MNWSIVISFIIIIGAFFLQFKSFRKTQINRIRLKSIFPSNPSQQLLIVRDEAQKGVEIVLKDDNRSRIFNDIISSINAYLQNNGGVAEYSILKDITDRNCDALKEQIESVTPVPIYYGLCGTLIGIVCGIGVLAFGGSLNDILSTSSSTGAEGIQSLLQGVAVAMITTLFGVFLTIWGSSTYKQSSEENEKRKNTFLSWIQSELLPQMDNSIMTTLNILQKNLNQFNDTFSKNSSNLKQVFDRVTENYKGQAEVSREIQKVLYGVNSLKIGDIASANIRVLKELQLCTEKINLLKEFLDQTAIYLSSIESLNNNLSNQYDRTRLIENMAQFFMDEVNQVEQRKFAINQTVADIDSSLVSAFDELKDHAKEQYQQLKEATATEQAYFLTAVEEQQNTLSQKLKETSELLEELHNLVDVKKSMSDLLETSSKQGVLLEDVKGIMREMVNGNIRQSGLVEQLIRSIDNISVAVEPVMPPTISMKVPVWVKIVGCFTSIVVVGTCAFFVIKQFI